MTKTIIALLMTLVLLVSGCISITINSYHIERQEVKREKTIKRLKNKQELDIEMYKYSTPNISSRQENMNHIDILEIINMDALPHEVYPGDKIVIKATYYLISKNINEKVWVQEEHILTDIEGRPINKPFVRTASKKKGYINTYIQIPIPKEARTGIYVVTFNATVKDTGLRDSSKTVFKVINRKYASLEVQGAES